MSAVPSAVLDVPAKPRPKPDKAAILAALAAMFEPDDVIELRAFPRGKKRTDAGYFDGEHREALADAAARLNLEGAAVYVTLNRIDPQLLGRYCNRIEQWASDTATDANVTRRRWLLIDLDPVRPKNTAATEAQVQAARDASSKCYRLLKAEGWPEPLDGESGNGFHLLYPLDLPNDANSTALVKGALAGLAARLDDDAVKVDQAVFNAARITKLYGTVATKGDHTPGAPWRLSALVSTPARGEPVTPDQLRALNPAPAAAPAATPRATASVVQSTFNLIDFLSRLGIEYDRDQHEGRDRYRLAHCPFNEAHGRGEAAILQDATGKLGFKCQHDSCSGKHWQDVRDLIDGPREARSRPQVDPATVRGAVGTAHARGAPTVESGLATWPEPRHIVAELPPAPTFDAATLLPPLLADYVLDEADRMPCPPDYIAAALMVAVGSVLGSRCALKPKRRDDWIVTPNLFGGCVGDPAAKKTPSIEKALRFLDRLEADEADRLEQRRAEYEAQLAAHKAREAAIEKSMKQAAGSRKTPEDAHAMDAAMHDLTSLRLPEEPHARRFRTNDATIEKIGDILSKSSDGILVFRDELVGLLSSWEREGREADRAFYLEGWNGLGSFAIDRIGRGSLLVRTLNLSVFGGIQPDLLGRYLANIVESSDNDGRIQRFQALVYPEGVLWEWRDRYPVHGARERVRDMFLRLAAFDPVQDGATPADDFVKVPHFAFDDAAQEVFIEWSADLHHNVVANEASSLLRQHFAKFEKLFCALALILHLSEGRIGPVQEDTALRAAAWTQYLAGHARRVYGLLEAQTVTAAQALANRIAAGKLADGFTARDVHRKGWAGLGTVHQVEAALGLLEEFGHVLGYDGGDGPGRPTTRYAINPKVQTRGPR